MEGRAELGLWTGQPHPWGGWMRSMHRRRGAVRSIPLLAMQTTSASPAELPLPSLL